MDDQKTVIALRFGDNLQGRTFEGIGGITSNGMSKLLMDYPQQTRDDILELLFRPGYGASLQHLKVEIGSDVNTSSGTEPSHMRRKDDYDITRGCGLQLAKLAKQIRPDLILDALRWGTPKWITNDEEKFDYYINFLRGARDVYGLEFDYLGPDINEGAFSRDWTVNTLRPGLDREGFGHVRLVADDSDHGWDIADHAAADRKLFEAVHAYGVHYRQDSTETAKESGKPLWLSEDLAPFRHSFRSGALHIGKRIVDMYAIGRMTKYEIHPLVEAEYENTPFNYKGIVVATWPWSGHYSIDPGLWVLAHFTQFAEPGWTYVDEGCGRTDSYGYVTLRSECTGDFSIVIVNDGGSHVEMDAELGGLLPYGKPLHVWRSDETEQFVRLSTATPDDGRLRLKLEPYAIYTVTTTTGQSKAGAKQPSIPQETAFPLPYHEDFSGYAPGRSPRYMSDQGGAFETGRCEDGFCLSQRITRDVIPLDWTYRRTPEPYTLLGSLEWTDYRVQVDVRLEGEESYAMLGGRVNYTAKSEEPPEGYLLELRRDGRWSMKRGQTALAQGQADAQSFRPDVWHRLLLTFRDKRIVAALDGVELAALTDGAIPSGHVALGSSYGETKFRGLSIEPLDEATPATCRRYDDRHLSLEYAGEWSEQSGDYNTYGRTLMKSNRDGDALTIRFRGTGVSIIGKWSADGGLADVYLNGEYKGTIDVFRGSGAVFRKAICSLYGLDAKDVHELKLVVAGRKHPDAQGAFVYVDAVEIKGERAELLAQDR